MPPKIQVTESQIIEGAVGIVKERGMEALNARSLAKVLGCSVQPIFRVFAGMDELKQRVTEEIIGEYRQYLLQQMAGEDALNGLLMAYIHYAQNEKQCFRLIHMSDRMGFERTQEFTGKDINKIIVDAMAEETGLSKEAAKSLYVGTFFAAHGIAAFLATNHCSFSDQEIQFIIGNVFDGLLLKLKGQDKKNMEEE